MFTFYAGTGYSQSLKEVLTKAMDNLQSNEQFRHAVLSMYVVESNTGKVVFDKNGQTGLAPASCQKVITSAAAFDLLGKNYQYKTNLAYQGAIKNNVLNGSLYLLGSGDPTLGSWRWNQTKEDLLLNKITSAILAKGIKEISGGFFGYTQNWETNNIPGGWIWEDMGNYYGAGATGLSWRENQYDLILKSGNAQGSAVTIVATKPLMYDVELISELRAGAKGSGDNAYIYLPPYANKGYVRGTIPAGENSFVISGSFPDPASQLMKTLAGKLKEKNIGCTQTTPYLNVTGKRISVSDLTSFFTMESPSLDSMNYWFLKKSINLYGEAFVKTIAYERTKFGSTDTGLAIIKDFWSRRGVEKSSLKILDGSGLSPANRVTTNALVTVMQYARKQPWFSSFYTSLPEMNGIKMKDGYIDGVRSYTGYIKSRSGTDYTFSFIVNNFDGSPGTVREKMWKLLDLLK